MSTKGTETEVEQVVIPLEEISLAGETMRCWLSLAPRLAQEALERDIDVVIDNARNVIDELIQAGLGPEDLIVTISVAARIMAGIEEEDADTLRAEAEQARKEHMEAEQSRQDLADPGVN